MMPQPRNLKYEDCEGCGKKKGAVNTHLKRNDDGRIIERLFKCPSCGENFIKEAEVDV